MFKRYYHLSKFVWIINSIIMLSACTTISYQFVPPSTQAGRMCLNECLRYKSKCKNNCEMKDMQQQSLNIMTNAVANNKNNYYTSPSYYNNYQCISDCEEDYRSCYENCGGQVIRVEQ